MSTFIIYFHNVTLTTRLKNGTRFRIQSQKQNRFFDVFNLINFDGEIFNQGRLRYPPKKKKLVGVTLVLLVLHHHGK